MFQLWKARKGRKAVLATLAPFIEGSEVRLGRIPAAAWHDAYILGFVSMLASLEARMALEGSLGSLALGLIQAETVAMLSGEPAGLHGEEILMLSMEGDPRFLNGCNQAVVFHAALQRSHRAFVDPSRRNEWKSDTPYLQDDLDALWLELFEEKVMALT